jgi:predicted SpoU family rRNA methylase
MLSKNQIKIIARELRLEKPLDWNIEITNQWERDVRAVARVLMDTIPKFNFQEFYRDAIYANPTDAPSK